MSRRPVDVTNQRFGLLVALKPSEQRGPDGSVYWSCSCDCGGSIETSVNRLRTGTTRSCGCLQEQQRKYGSITHGHSMGGQVSPTYAAWANMINRCTNPQNPEYEHYGGRGVRVCQKWLDSFQEFLFDMGEKPEGYLLDRENNNGHYIPENCRWVDYSTSNKNRRPFTKGKTN